MNTENGITKGRYQLPKTHTRIIGQPVSNYLETFSINPNLDEHQEFVITKIFHSWPHCSEHIQARPLNEYFGEESHTHDFSFLDRPADVKGFIAAEDYLLDTIVDQYSMKEGRYLPIPCEKNGKLTGVIYLLYDEKTLSPEEKELIEAIVKELQESYQ
ncbi:MAG: hypothetical protein AAFQ68_04495 [Bacteroidota bacterium]